MKCPGILLACHVWLGFLCKYFVTFTNADVWSSFPHRLCLPCDAANTPDYNRLSAALQAYHQLHAPVWRLISVSRGCADNHHFPPSESTQLSLPGVEAQLSLWSLFLLLAFTVVTTFSLYCSLSPERSTCATQREVTQGVAQTKRGGGDKGSGS